MLIDITHPVEQDRTAVWPGDTPPSREILMDLAQGDSVTLSTIRTTLHLGTHADGPCHYGIDASGIGEMGLDHYIGRCRVIRVEVEPGTCVGVEHLDDAPLDAQRILIDTGTFNSTERFREDFAALDPALIDHLAAHGVVTVGLDSPSVDLIDSKDLPAHARCLSHGMAILETLRLTDVEPETYELFAQPLKLMGMDGSPDEPTSRSRSGTSRSRPRPRRSSRTRG